MRTVSGTLARALRTDDPDVALEGHAQPYIFELAGMAIEAPVGSDVRLTLITVTGPNPANHSRLDFDVERVARVDVERPEAVRLVREQEKRCA